MHRTLFFKKFLMPCGLCAAVPAMKPPPPPEEKTTPCNNETKGKKLIKPSELPIYVDDGFNAKEMPCIQQPQEYPSVVEENIRKVRRTVGEIKLKLDRVSNDVSNTFDNLKFIIDYLQDEANLMPRIGAVGIGGLSGLVLGLRGGIFKKLLYTTAGASVVGCICFPKEAREAFNTVEHYGNISYNFIYGVLGKPCEEVPDAHNISFNLKKEDSKLLEPINLKEIPADGKTSKNSKSLIK